MISGLEPQWRLAAYQRNSVIIPLRRSPEATTPLPPDFLTQLPPRTPFSPKASLLVFRTGLEKRLPATKLQSQ